MNELVEKNAIVFSDRWFQLSSGTIESLSEHLDDKVRVFNNKNKLYFFTVLRKKVLEDKIQHEKNCTGCSYSEDRDNALFIIDQELEALDKHYTPETKNGDVLSHEERANLHVKLNEILDRFQKLEFGQQIIHEEIEKVGEELDILKQHFSLGKKSWFELAAVKLMKMGVEYGIEETVIKGIFNELTQQVENVGITFLGN